MVHLWGVASVVDSILGLPRVLWYSRRVARDVALGGGTVGAVGGWPYARGVASVELTDMVALTGLHLVENLVGQSEVGLHAI